MMLKGISYLTIALFFLISFSHAFSASVAETPVILEVLTNPPVTNNWVTLKPKQTLSVNVGAVNVRRVNFYFVPGGTGTWSARKLIGFDEEGKDGWSLQWISPSKSIHGHIVIEAIGSDDRTAKAIINVSSNL
jgi:hypothetical protein